METYLRTWRDSALSKSQYQTAEFVGDKVLALTNADEDAFTLAQIHFAAANYTRALTFVSRSDSLQRSSAARYLAAHCYIKQNRHEDALSILGEKNPVHLITTSDSARRKLQHVSNSNGVASRQLGSKAKLPARSERVDRSEEREREDAESIKYEASMCYLRGLCYAKQNAFDKAKGCYKDAVRIDVQCFEAFDQLMKNSLMSPGEEWEFLESLNFDSVITTLSSQNNNLSDTTDATATAAPAQAADLTRLLYTTRLSKYTNPSLSTTALETLSTHYNLASNADILLAKAEALFTTSRFAPALSLTTQILTSDPYNFATLPLHLALLHQTNATNALFSLAHDLADTHPEEACTWVAVGTYYLATNRIPEARSYFSKASLMNPHFGPAWIGFAHTFAAEGENDQAIAAYSTAARLFQGTHLPQLFLGMQEIALGNLNIAREYLTAAYGLCDGDPLLINELGVVSYLEDDAESAVRQFTLALNIAADNETPPQQNVSTRLNLAHALRKSLRFPEALEQFDEVLRLGLREAGVFASKGLVLLELDQPLEATVALHEALSLSPQDPIASDLLRRALELLEESGVLGGAEEEGIDAALKQRLAEARARGPRRRRTGGGKRVVEPEEQMDLDGTSDARRH